MESISNLRLQYKSDFDQVKSSWQTIVGSPSITLLERHTYSLVVPYVVNPGVSIARSMFIGIPQSAEIQIYSVNCCVVAKHSGT